MQHHPTRDHRFAYISTGEISWARATSPAARPHNVRQTATSSPVVNLDAVRKFAARPPIIEAARPDEIVLPCITKNAKPDEGDGVLAKAVDERLAISDAYWKHFSGGRQ